MEALDLYRLLHKVIAENPSNENSEITCNGGFQVITDIEYCKDCSQFHIVTEPTDAAKELLNGQKVSNPTGQHCSIN